MIRVVVADDHAVVRRGLEAILQDHADLAVVAGVSDFPGALDAVESLDPDVVILDISMPGGTIQDALRRIRSRSPSTRILVLSGHPEDQFALRMLRGGASGYLTKESAPVELVEAVRTIARGERYVSRPLAGLLADLVAGGGSPAPAHEALSEREFQVMVELARGQSASEVAARLFLSVKTVSTYRTRLLQKLGLRNNAELIRYALDHRLVS
jgi:two-component system, NarL family, invasion response regulator UvrY